MNNEIARAKRLLKEHKGSIEIDDFYYFYSILYCRQGHFRKALPLAKEAYRISPEDLDKARIYAWALSSASPKDLEKNTEALNLIDHVINEREKSDSLNKDFLYDLNVKSHILYRLGRYYEVRDNIKKTADLFPDSQLPLFIQLLYEKSVPSLSSREPNVVDHKFFIKWILGIIATVISAIIIYIIKFVI
jgi:tetratricopeptide (TPR) repeat protein